ncbi:MAG: [FeFe] hydrogenase H-cluster radical SAM maturase HydE [Planctomycetota bacterium]|jgi:biotin synthase|nr:[FeFe] hydrogenase H-cluster radical SAM maturase HydE [Planctomycetota bacterium]
MDARTENHAVLPEVLDRAAAGRLSRADLAFLLSLEDAGDCRRLFAAAYAVKLRHIGKNVSLRGLIEMGNVCAKNCLYCGIRKDNARVERYLLDADAVVRMAEWAWGQRYGSVVIQSGEIESAEHANLICGILRRIADFSGGELGVTLSLGEQDGETFRRWREAGAHRYLLRIETSSPRLYRELHPPDHSFARRLECLRQLRSLGYQVGTGVMCGLPGQTAGDLADDLAFFADLDIDMIGMGPYIPHPDTPLGAGLYVTDSFRARQLRLGLKMIAAARLYLRDVNIAAATALQALADNGREQGLKAGANVIMPNVTDLAFRRNYQLYAGKPCLEENADHCRGCLALRVAGVGENILWGERGDSEHYRRRTFSGRPRSETAKSPIAP